MMEHKVTFGGLGIFVLAALALTASDTDFKIKFGEELGFILGKYNAEKLQKSLDNMAEFYNTFIRDGELTPREERAYGIRLASITVMKNRIGDSVTEETMKMVTQFNKIVAWELMLYPRSTEMTNDPEKLKAFNSALASYVHKENEVIKEYHDKLYQKWRDMYKTIPAEELQNHVEYTEINDLLEKSAGVDILKNGADTREALRNVTEAFQKLVLFFDLKEFKFLFQKHSA